MGHSVSSIVQSARGDLRTEVLEEVESRHGINTFLEQNEKIQYIGLSFYGPRIKTDTANSIIGKVTISFITDRAVRLIVGEYSDEISLGDVGFSLFNEKLVFRESDIRIDHDNIETVEFSSGILKDKITIHTNDDFQIDFGELKIEDLGKLEEDQTVSSPSLRFRLQSSTDSGVSVDDIVSYMEEMSERWKSVESRYSKLKRKSRRLYSKQFEIPKPDSFESVKECEKKYNELEQAIGEWESAERDYAELNKIHSKIVRQAAESSAEEIWVENLPEVVSPAEFDTATDATDEYDSMKRGLNSKEAIITQAVELEDRISDYGSKNMGAGTVSTAIQNMHKEITNNLDSQREISEVKSNLEQLNDLLSLSSTLTDKMDNLPIDPTQKLIDSIQDEGLPEPEELQEWQDLIQKVEKISTFMDETDLSHPSIDAEHWEESLEMALEEQYVNILSPIVDQVEKMESGVWELDDLHQISWQEFESLIGTLYESFGYETEVTSDTADMGIDVWAKNSDERVAIQAKRYQEGNTVGRETLQKLASTLAKGDADRVIVVTTSEFARTAKEYSDSFGSEIELIDGEELRDQLNNSDIPPIN